MKLEESLKQAIEENDKIIERKIDKLKTSPLTPSKVHRLFQVLAAEYRIPYSTEDFEHDKGRGLGMAGNWVKECEANNTDLAKLADLIYAELHWLRRNIKELGYGGQQVNFTMFYSNRSKIMEALKHE